MDAIDKQMISLLKENARLPAATIARQVNLSVPAVLERMKKLTKCGTIERFTIGINRKHVGLTLLAFVLVRLSASAHIESFRQRVVQFACVLECHHIAGEYDYLLKVATSDTAVLERFLTDELKQVEGVDGTNTLIVLTTLKEDLNG